ncbi:precorrin-3B C(17)-methyltransferase [Clostridium aminobutyricum]|uniref:Precorrin-3B C(17)-methyltransferase n=1 Tax=Clostridium aminobutyricum TaxID=33953 RepID=A0A939D6Z9_CLOAM|nr:precorrin-3B C(17)-methyltransferase [Clostridium aminobutyricum]MBN7772397.1 precorrin-3B C(17)-methyltransferase [Clostridium aminobutyricum]
MKKIFVVGLGPGELNQATGRALEALENSDIIVGYTVYIDLIKEHFQHKKLLSTAMKKEAERCMLAVKEAQEGQVVSMICSGDAGVYGMAGLMFEVAEAEGLLDELDIEIIPGITAACSGAAVLGAPLMHDFAVISLSDLLTPWELIEKRLEAAAFADFSICIYNPSSIKRHDYLQKACDILLKHRSPDNVAGFVQNIGREGEQGIVMDLQTLRNTKVDMFTTVFIGTSQTKNINGKMITPRGYHLSGGSNE